MISSPAQIDLPRFGVLLVPNRKKENFIGDKLDPVDEPKKSMAGKCASVRCVLRGDGLVEIRLFINCFSTFNSHIHPLYPAFPSVVCCSVRALRSGAPFGAAVQSIRNSFKFGARTATRYKERMPRERLTDSRSASTSHRQRVFLGRQHVYHTDTTEISRAPTSR